MRLPWALAWRLSLGQIVAWGVLYYAFTVVVGPMESATGWSRTFLNCGLSLGLLTWGVFALPAGAWIQRRGGRSLMAGTSALGGVALIVMGAFPYRTAYVAAWLMLGLAMAGMLYDSAFAVVTQAFGQHYRRGITLITLVGGLASTVFIPVAQFAVDHLGWQRALIALGAFQTVLGVPLHALGVPRVARQPRELPTESAFVRWRAWWAEIRRDVSDPRFVGLALWFTAHAAAFTGLIFQLVPILQAFHVDNAAILQAIAIIGPMQVLGRFLLTSRGNRFSTLRVGRWAVAALLAAMLILLFLPPRLIWLALFAGLYGAGNGVTTILRGTSIAELFGRERYAELNGALSAPAVLAKAAAPLVLAGLWSVTGEPKIVFAGVLALVVTGVGGLWFAAGAQRRHTTITSEHRNHTASVPSRTLPG
jgi:MFS family permease